MVVLKAARSGIIAGIILGMGRAIGETMAVIMVAGNQARMPKGLLQGVRTMTNQSSDFRVPFAVADKLEAVRKRAWKVRVAGSMRCGPEG